MPNLLAPIEVFSAVFLLGACVSTAYPIAVLFTPDGSLSGRWSATAIISAWLLTFLFYALISISAFRLSVVLPLWLVLGVLVWVSSPAMGVRRDQASRDLLQLWRAVRWPARLPALLGMAVAAVVGIRAYRGLIAPPLAWDALTYHLLKAGRWVQHGGWVAESAPDAWSYYEYFPPGGDLFWAWAMLPGHSDTLVAVAGVLVWLTCLLGGYGAARALDGSRRAALGTAGGIVVLPCVLNFLTSAYVTSLQLAFLLLALTFIARTFRSRRVSDVVLAVASLGLASGVQPSSLPLMAVGIAALGLALARHRGLWFTVRAMTLSLLVCAPMLAGYGWTWIQTGSPLYPLPLSIAGRTVWEGNQQLVGVLSGEYLDPRMLAFGLLHFVRRQVHDVTGFQLNLGPGAIALVGLGGIGAWLMLREAQHRATAIVWLAFSVIPLAGMMSDLMLAQRTLWVGVSGRFLAPGVAALALAGARVPGRAADWVRGLAVLVGVVYGIPRGFTDVDWMAMRALAPYAASSMVLVLLGSAMGWSWSRVYAGVLVGAVLSLLVLSYGLESTRAAFRYRIYRAAGAPTDRAAYDLHPLEEPAVGWQVWQDLDGRQPQRIAFAAGWDGIGHSWYRYPLLGSRLQNTVVYVPPAQHGEIIDYRNADEFVARADFAAWLRRLLDQRIDVVVIGWPDPPELNWTLGHPAVFVPIGDSANVSTRAFRVVTASAEGLLSAER